MGDFVTEYLSKNGRRNHIIGEFPINESVQLVGLSEIWGSGLMYIPNLMAHVEATGSSSSFNYSNQSWGVSSTDTTNMTNIT